MKPRNMELTGKTFGYWTCLRQTEERRWLCRCCCGQEQIVEEADLVCGISTSCGCHRSRSENLRGLRFGALTAVDPLPNRDSDNCVRWLCRCDCGEYTIVSSNRLKTGHTSSCGCRKYSAGREGLTYVNGTCMEILFSQKLRRNNTSGHTGVSKRRGKWYAYITFRGKMKTLGTFDTYEEAVVARENEEARVKSHISAFLTEPEAESSNEPERTG